MDDTFKTFPKLFVDEMIKMDELSYQSCVLIIKSYKIWQIKSINGTNAYFKIRMDKYFELCIFFKNVPCNQLFS